MIQPLPQGCLSDFKKAALCYIACAKIPERFVILRQIFICNHTRYRTRAVNTTFTDYTVEGLLPDTEYTFQVSSAIYTPLHYIWYRQLGHSSALILNSLWNFCIGS